MRPLIASCVLLSAIAFAVPSFAQGQPASGTDTPPASSAAPPTDGAAPPADKPATDPAASKKPFDEGFSPVDDAEKERKRKEDQNKTQWFLGYRFRDFIVPAFIFHLFAKGGPGAVNVFSSGPELTMRSGNLEADFSFTIPYTDASMKEFMFKGRNQPDEAYEKVHSSLKIFSVSADLMGNIPFDKARRFSMLVGAGLSIGGVFGNLYRDQAYPTNGDPKTSPDDPSKWSKCTGPANPKDPSNSNNVVTAPKDGSPGKAYCDTQNNHYYNPATKKDFSEPSWAHGGSKPFIFPNVSLIQLSFRAQPIKLLQLRVDGGFSMLGFFVGAAAGLKLPI